jgi:hypothetical protein
MKRLTFDQTLRLLGDLAKLHYLEARDAARSGLVLEAKHIRKIADHINGRLHKRIEVAITSRFRR